MFKWRFRKSTGVGCCVRKRVSVDSDCGKCMYCTFSWKTASKKLNGTLYISARKILAFNKQLAGIVKCLLILLNVRKIG